MDAAILRAAGASRQNYRYYSAVCGVSVGAKYTDEKLVEGVEAVQFFVTNKPAQQDLKKLLPKFVFGRRPDGGIDTSVRFPTDVIELKNLRLCCGAGDKLELTSGRAGGSTLIFPMAAAAGFYALTCSHVVGDMAASPATAAEVRAGNETCFFRANVLANTVLSNGALEYDIALAQLIAPSPATLVACSVSAAGVVLTSFGDVDALVAQAELTLACPLSQGTIAIQSARTEIRDVRTPMGDLIKINNVHACKGKVREGDSGGLAYIGTDAYGIVVAKDDDDWVFIQSLEDAVAHLAQLAGVALDCFPP